MLCFVTIGYGDLYLTKGISTRIICLGKPSKLHYCQSMNPQKSTTPFAFFPLNRERDTITTKPNVGRVSIFSIFKRLLNLGLVVIGMLICANLWIIHSKQQEIWYHQQANQLGRSLATLSAQALVQSVIDKDDKFIAHYLHILVNDPNILGVAVYNQKGQLVQQQDTESPIIKRYLDSETAPLTFIQEMRTSDNEVVGYLRIELDEAKIMQFHFEYQQQSIEQVEVLLLLAAIAGGIITRAFYTIRYRQYRRQLKEQLNSSNIV
jgi:membrane protein